MNSYNIIWIGSRSDLRVVQMLFLLLKLSFLLSFLTKSAPLWTVLCMSLLI